MRNLTIPAEVVRMNLMANGEEGRAWLTALPGIVDELIIRWGLTVGPAFEGGCVGFVAPAERHNGQPVVLKVSFVDEETRHEADALSVWNGDGAVLVLEADPGRGALLLERAEPGTLLGDHPDRDQAISIACRLLHRLWRPLADPHPFLPIRDLALRWTRELPDRFDELGRPFEATLLRRVTDLCEELSSSTDEPVLANRDFHLWNILAAQREPWLLIDPKPLVGERAFDSGHFLRGLLPDLLDRPLVDGMIHRLASDLDLDPERIRAWALVRSVEDALWGLKVGGSDVEWDLRCARLLAGLR